MTKKTNVAVFPVAIWPGINAETIAAQMLAAEARDGMDGRGAVLTDALRTVRERLEASRLSREIRREEIGRWASSVFSAEHRLRSLSERSAQ